MRLSFVGIERLVRLDVRVALAVAVGVEDRARSSPATSPRRRSRRTSSCSASRPPAPPPLVHSVLFASSANIRWCVPKQVLMCVSFFVFGSYTASCRPERCEREQLRRRMARALLAEGRIVGGRTADVIHTRPFSSNIGLWTLFLLVQIASSPQYGDGCGIVGGVARRVRIAHRQRHLARSCCAPDRAPAGSRRSARASRRSGRWR